MSLDELKKECAALSTEEQRELATFLTILRMKQSGGWNEATVSQRSKDTDPTHWIPPDESERRLA